MKIKFEDTLMKNKRFAFNSNRKPDSNLMQKNYNYKAS